MRDAIALTQTSLNTLTMNRKKYVAPAIDIIIMQTEGMIAGSNHQPSIPLRDDREINKSEGIYSIETEEPASFDLNDN